MQKVGQDGKVTHKELRHFDVCSSFLLSQFVLKMLALVDINFIPRKRS